MLAYCFVPKKKPKPPGDFAIFMALIGAVLVEILTVMAVYGTFERLN